MMLPLAVDASDKLGAFRNALHVVGMTFFPLASVAVPARRDTAPDGAKVEAVKRINLMRTYQD
jgi:hypothetical protein